MDASHLAVLDGADAVNPDPQTLSENLDALGAEQPALAARLAETVLPDHWRPVRALDAFTTWRIESAGEPAVWLDGSALPARRAAALLSDPLPPDRNIALPAIGTGAELCRLLARLNSTQAVFVFEPDSKKLRAVMATQPLAAEIRSGRCIFVPAERASESLRELLEEHSGLLPPQQVIGMHTASVECVQSVRKLCEPIGERVMRQREQRLRERIQDRSHISPSAAQAIRVAILALDPDPIAHALAADLETAAQSLGWQTRICRAAGPRAVHALAHAEALAGFAADLSIAVKHAPGRLPFSVADVACRLHTSRIIEARGLDDPHVVHLAATPTIAADLRRAGLPADSIRSFHHAIRSDLPAIETDRPADDRVVLVADRPDDSPAACGIVQPTHKQLWECLQRTAERGWETDAIRSPQTLLSAAESAGGVKLNEADLRARMTRIVEHVLIPAVVLERIVTALESGPYDWAVVGRGWDGRLTDPRRIRATGLFNLPEEQWRRQPRAVLFAGPLDPLSPALLRCAAHGWPLLIHAPGRMAMTTALGKILHPQQHFAVFAGAKELLRVLKTHAPGVPQVQRRCERARAHLLDAHTWKQRLQELAEDLRLISASRKK